MKSFDIKAGNKRKKSARAYAVPIKLQKVTARPSRERTAKLPRSSAVISKSSPWKKTLIGSAGLIILLLAIFGFLVLPEAHVKVTLRTEPVTRDFQITVDKNQVQLDTANLAIPGQVLLETATSTKSYVPTGTKNVGRTASGFVTIYNFSKTPLILKAQTTMLAANGHHYRFARDVAGIRPTALLGLDNQEVDPSSLTPPVAVIAAGPGEEYNLPKGTRLEIQNQTFGNQPKLLYGMTADGVSGGTTETIKIVTPGDLTAAVNSLSQDLVQEAKVRLTGQNPDLQFLDGAVNSSTISQKTSAPAGTATSHFDATVVVRLQVLVYKDSDLRSLITERIKRLLPANQILQIDQNTRLSSSFGNVNLDQGQGILNTHFESLIIYQADEQELLTKIKGKSADEIREILLSRPEIAGVEVKFYPFWVKTAPNFSRKIFLQVVNSAP